MTLICFKLTVLLVALAACVVANCSDIKRWRECAITSGCTWSRAKVCTSVARPPTIAGVAAATRAPTLKPSRARPTARPTTGKPTMSLRPTKEPSAAPTLSPTPFCHINIQICAHVGACAACYGEGNPCCADGYACGNCVGLENYLLERFPTAQPVFRG